MVPIYQVIRRSGKCVEKEKRGRREMESTEQGVPDGKTQVEKDRSQSQEKWVGWMKSTWQDMGARKRELWSLEVCIDNNSIRMIDSS
jgi:hypothetical protein